MGLGWFFVAWINMIAAINMGLAYWKSAVEAYQKVREYCIKRKLKIHNQEDQHSILNETKQYLDNRKINNNCPDST